MIWYFDAYLFTFTNTNKWPKQVFWPEVHMNKLALQIWCRSAGIYAISDINVIIGVVCSQLKPQRVWRSSLIFLVRWVSMTPRGAKPRRRWICQRKTTKMTASSRSDTSSFRTSTVWLYVTVHDMCFQFSSGWFV